MSASSRRLPESGPAASSASSGHSGSTVARFALGRSGAPRDQADRVQVSRCTKPGSDSDSWCTGSAPRVPMTRWRLFRYATSRPMKTSASWSPAPIGSRGRPTEKQAGRSRWTSAACLLPRMLICSPSLATAFNRRRTLRQTSPPDDRSSGRQRRCPESGVDGVHCDATSRDAVSRASSRWNAGGSGRLVGDARASGIYAMQRFRGRYARIWKPSGRRRNLEQRADRGRIDKLKTLKRAMSRAAPAWNSCALMMPLQENQCAKSRIGPGKCKNAPVRFDLDLI